MYLDNYFIKISKILFSSIVQTIAFSFFIYYLVQCLEHPESFWAPLDQNDYRLPAYIQAQRAWALWFFIFFLSSTTYIFYKSFFLQKGLIKFYLQFSLSLIFAINLAYALYEFIHNKITHFWINRIKTKNDIEYMVSFYSFVKIVFFKSAFPRKKIGVNFVAYATLIACILAFALNLIIFDKEPENDFYLSNYYIFDKWSYFTQLTNTLCFIFILWFLNFKDSIVSKNKNIKIVISAHIAVVSSIYLLILFPALLIIGDNSLLSWWGILSSFNQHLFVPFFFAIFMFSIMNKEKEMPINFIYCLRKGFIFPSWYSIYAYLLSFITRFSPYLAMTNMNPAMKLGNSDYYGNYWNVLFYIPMMIFHIVWFFFFWIINVKLSGNDIHKAIRNNFWFIKPMKKSNML